MKELNIRSWLAGKVIFVTGGTGFLGKALIGKLLLDCSDLEKIFILLRAKSDEHMEERLNEYKKNDAFERIRRTRADLLDKLHPIRGDLCYPHMGLSENDKNLLITEVHVVLHSGASVMFNETIRNAVLLNTRGTLQMLQLAKQMKNLQSFVHISTAYSNCNYKEIEEKIYPPLYDPKIIIDLCDRPDLDIILSKVLRTYPNTYIFSKNLAEKIVYDAHKDLPVAITRPSIITSAVKDPCPGWLENKYGLVGVLIGCGSGLVRTGYGKLNALVDIVPVDYAANGIIAAAVNVGQNNVENCPVYNFTTGADFPVTWDLLFKSSKKVYKKNPFVKSVWFPGGRMLNCYYAFLITYFLIQLIPAFFFDAIHYLVKRKFFFVKTQKKIYANLMILSYFCLNSWIWDQTNVRQLYDNLTPIERDIFNFRAHNLKFWKYIMDWNKGIRRFLYGKHENASADELRTMTILYYLDIILKIAFVSYVIYWIKGYFYFISDLSFSNFYF